MSHPPTIENMDALAKAKRHAPMKKAQYTLRACVRPPIHPPAVPGCADHIMETAARTPPNR